MLQLQKWNKGTIFRGQGRDQGHEKISMPRTEFWRTSALEGKLKPERSRRRILQLFGWRVIYFQNFRGLELECSLSTFTVQISIFA